MSEEKTFGALLNSYLKMKGITGSHVAKRLNVHRATVSRWRTGALLPATLNDVERLADVLGLYDQATRDGLFEAAGFLRRESVSEERERRAHNVVVTNTVIGTTDPLSVPLEVALSRVATLPLTLPPIQTLPARSRMPFSPNPHFVGRRAVLEAIAARMAEPFQSQVAIVVSGIGGVGKSQLVVELAHRYGYYFAGGVFWLSFAEAENIPAEVAACGLGGALDVRADFYRLPLDEQIVIVQQAWQSAMPRLLIFDSCEDEGLLEKWRPPSGGSRIIVTSRSAVWSTTLGIEVFALEALPRAESIKLLATYRSDLAGYKEPDRIAALLGDLPLALHLAGSYLNRYQYQPALGHPRRYLERIEHHNPLNHASLQGAGSKRSPTQHEQHLARTFALSYDRLSDVDPIAQLARALLSFSGCMAPTEPIPRHLLLVPFEYSAEEAIWLQLEDAIHYCLTLGLLTQQPSGALVMHRLIARFICAQQENEVDQARVEQALAIEARSVNQSNDPAQMQFWQVHLRHVTLAAVARQSPFAIPLSHELGVHLSQMGDYKGALPFLLRALTLREQNKESVPSEIAQSRHSLGKLYYRLGRYTEAQTELEAALQLQEAALGTTHIETLQTLNDLALLFVYVGHPTSTEAYLRVALQRTEASCGAQHPLVAQSLNNLGQFFYRQGALSEARSFLGRALTIREEILGASHPDTASSLNNMGVLLHQLGEGSSALEYYRRTLEITELQLGRHHPATAQSLNNVGLLLYREGRGAEALPYLESALSIREAILGEHHPHTGQTLNNLGTLLESLTLYEQALRCYERALTIFKGFPTLYKAECRNVWRNLMALRYRLSKL